jgi:ribonuclease BN (tRNA processing enzyme)
VGQGLTRVPFSVTVLGSSAMFQTLERAASGYLLEYEDARIWIDAGGGTWRNLIDHMDHRELDGILLSHRHPDHTIDVFQAFHARHYGSEEPLDPIPLWAPQETVDRLTSYASEFESSFDVQTIAAGESFGFEGARFSFFEMAHPVDTVGVRFQHTDGSFAYSADTGPGGDLAGLAAEVDVLMCEATFQDSDEEWHGHMRASQAGTVAAQANVGHLLLTHLPSGRDLGLSVAEAHRNCEGIPVELASDGRRIEVGK